MSVLFKKNQSISGKIKYLVSVDGKFVNEDTGEEINVAEIINSYIGETPFELSISVKVEEEL